MKEVSKYVVRLFKIFKLTESTNGCLQMEERCGIHNEPKIMLSHVAKRWHVDILEFIKEKHNHRAKGVIYPRGEITNEIGTLHRGKGTSINKRRKKSYDNHTKLLWSPSTLLEMLDQLRNTDDGYTQR